MDEESKAKFFQLIRTQKNASLGTTLQGQPLVSMVLYSASSDLTSYAIHISQLAQHTQNIMNDPRVSLMICESVRKGINPQTLARISIMGKAMLLSSMSTEYAAAKESYLAKYPFAKMNFQLGDFSMYAIKLEAVRYVAGFGKAFRLTPADIEALARAEA